MDEDEIFMPNTPGGCTPVQDEMGDGPASPDNHVVGSPMSGESYASGSPMSDQGYIQSPSQQQTMIDSPSQSFGSAPASPDDSMGGSPMSEHSESPPGSPEGSYDETRSQSVSPAGSRSRSVSPEGSRSQSGSSAGSRSRSVSPAGSRSRSVSPYGSRSRSVSSAGSRSRSVSPAGSRSRSVSPAGSRSRSVSPSGSRSRSVSPAGSRSRSVSPAGSRSRSVSPAGSRSRSVSPAGSRSRSVSPAGSRSRSVSPVGSRSRSVSPAGSRSRSVSPAGSRSRSVSSAGSRSRSVSPAGSRSRSVSPAGSRSRSVSSAGSRSRSVSSAGSRSRSVSPAGSRSVSPKSTRSRSPSPKGAAASEGAAVIASASRAAGDDDSDKESAVGELIADIFGSSDEDEEFEGFGEADVQAKPQKKERKPVVGGSDDENMEGEMLPAEQAVPDMSSDDEVDDMKRKEQPEDFVSDFDLMLMKKKEEMRKRRKKRRDVDIISDNDDLIVSLIKKMKETAEEDRDLNQQRQPAVKKLKMLTPLMSQLKKTDLHIAFLDLGILGAMTEWLAPLPDKSLPHLKIREALLRQLVEFPPINSELLKNSGVGKAVMYLYKHPKEIRPNKQLAGKLINEWSRPIFNLTSNYKSLSREEREQRDYEQLPKKRRLNLEGGMTPHPDLERELSGKDREAKPGMPGFVGRARVPQPSKKDYVIRPKWNVEEEPKRSSSKKVLTKLEKHQRAFAEKKKNSKQQRAVAISIEGRNMAL